jgi:hypothetical protein
VLNFTRRWLALALLGWAVRLRDESVWRNRKIDPLVFFANFLFTFSSIERSQ